MKNQLFKVGDKVQILVGELQGEVREVIYDEHNLGVNLEDPDSTFGMFYSNFEIEKVD